MTVEIQEVRNFLNNISSQRIPDNTIKENIEVANTMIQSEKSATATSEQVRDATLVYAAFLSLSAYAGQFERSVGSVPTALKDQLNLLKTIADSMLQYVKRANLSFLPLVAQPKTLREQYVDGELEGEAY